MPRLIPTLVFVFASSTLAVPQALAQSLADGYYPGTWKLSLAKSKPAGPGQKESIMVVEDRGCGVLVSTIRGISAEGRETFTQYVQKFDGKDYPMLMLGSPTAGTVAATVAAPYVIAYQQKQNGKNTAFGTRTISKDGKRLEVVVNGTDAQGKPTSSLLVWDKQ